MSDYNRVCYEIRPCDILLIEGRSRMSSTISFLTRSPWTHACIYIGRLQDLDDKTLAKHIRNNYEGDENEHLVIGSYLGRGTTVEPLSKYRRHHIRICRPRAIAPQDVQSVIKYCIHAIGYDYNTRQIFDMLRLLFPITLMPRKLFSSLFKFDQDSNKQTICSSLLAEAFHKVSFPILPKIIVNESNKIELIPRNPKLFAPGDFDYSPFFDIIKYPIFGMTESSAVYKQLPWNIEGVYSNDEIGLSKPKPKKK